MSIEIRHTVVSPEAGQDTGMAGYWPGADTTTSSLPATIARLDTLEHKTVYLVDTGFGGSFNFMLQLQKWFSEHMPSVTTIRRRKPGNVFMDDNDELWEEIRDNGHAVVLGVAG